MESLIYFKYITNEPVARHSCAGGNLKFRVAAVIFVCTGTTDKPGPPEKYFQTAPPEQTVHAAPLPCSLPFPAPPSRANRAISVRFHAECPL